MLRYPMLSFIKAIYPNLAPEIPDWRVHIEYAGCFIDQKLFEKALASLDKALLTGGDEYDCVLQVAMLYGEMKHWPIAFDFIERAIALAPDRKASYDKLLALSLTSGQFERACKTCKKLIKKIPRHVAAHSTLGTLYLQMGQLDSAMRVTNTLIRLEPEEAKHHFKKAYLHKSRGDIGLAIQEFSEVIRLSPCSSQAKASEEALEFLDSLQIDQIFTLAMEDQVFRTKLQRDVEDAITERGYELSEVGLQILRQLTPLALTEMSLHCSSHLYN